MPLLMTTSKFRLGRRCWSSAQQCYVHHLCAMFCSDNWSEFEAPATGQVGTHRTLQQVHIRGSGKVQVGKSSECWWLFAGSDLHCAEGESAATSLQHPVHHSVCQPETSHVGRGWILLHEPREFIVHCQQWSHWSASMLECRPMQRHKNSVIQINFM